MPTALSQPWKTGRSLILPVRKWGLMQSAIANNISDYLRGEKDAATALADMEADYVVSAKEAGILN